MEVLGNLAVCRVTNHGHVGGRHHGGDLDGGVFGVGRHVGFFLIRWGPLMGTGRTLGQFPSLVVLEKHVKVAVIPLRWVSRPCTFDTAGDGVSANA